MEQLARQYLSYCPVSGEIRWKLLPKMFNHASVGDLAGTLDNGYLRITLGGKKYRAHRIAFILMGYEVPEQVDHINGIRHDNRWCNLRVANPSINAKNAKSHSNNTSGICGVSYSKRHNKWKARVSLNGQELYLGLYEDKLIAEQTVIKARSTLGYSERHGSTT